MTCYVVEVGRVLRDLYGPFWSEDQAHGFIAGQRGHCVIRELLSVQPLPDFSGPSDSPGAILLGMAGPSPERGNGFK